jgi:hypothetical protein
MSYKTLIDNVLVKSFTNLKDLAVDVTFVKKTNPDFNFTTSATSFGSTANVSAKCVVVSTKKNSKDRNTINKKMLVKSKDVGDLNSYSTVLLESKTWNISQIQKNDGFILILEIYSEA